MSKDSFQILADEITLIRGEIENLQRTSLNKDEAKTLHQIVAKSVTDLQKATPALEKSIERQLATSMDAVREEAVKAAREAAERAVTDAHSESIQSAKKLTEAASEVHREAWRYFGGFWVWIGLLVTAGAVMGILGTLTLQGRADAMEFARNAQPFCGYAKGSDTSNTDGRKGCMVWYDRQ